MLFLAIINTFNVIVSLHNPYYYLVTKYGNILSLTKSVWSFAIAQAAGEASNFVIRFLYAHRVWHLSRGNIWPVACIIVTSVATLGLCVYISVAIGTARVSSELHFSAQYKAFRQVVDVSFAMSLIAEASVTFAMTYYLYRLKTGFSHTNSVISLFIKYIFGTGLLATINACVAMGFYYTYPLALYSSMVFTSQSKLYICSYLALLNARNALREPPTVQMQTLESVSSQQDPHLSQVVEVAVRLGEKCGADQEQDIVNG